MTVPASAALARVIIGAARVAAAPIRTWRRLGRPDPGKFWFIVCLLVVMTVGTGLLPRDPTTPICARLPGTGRDPVHVPSNEDHPVAKCGSNWTRRQRLSTAH